MTPSEDQQHVDFLRLYVEHEEALRGFVRALVPTREDARDVMQEVTVVLWRKIGELSAMEDFRRWAFGVARMDTYLTETTEQADRHPGYYPMTLVCGCFGVAWMWFATKRMERLQREDVSKWRAAV